MSLRFRWWSPILLGIILAVIVAAVGPFRRELLRAAGRALVVEGSVETADVIVLPEWAGRAGAIEAADLVHTGVSARVAIVAEPPRTADRELARRSVAYTDEITDLSQLLNSLGITAIESVQGRADGTESEGQLLPIWCEQNRFKSIVVVSTPDHSRRIGRVLHRSMGVTKIMIRSARYSSFDPDSWWRTRDGTRTEIIELEKLLLDVARHPIS